jgi:hypothetical protein
MRTPSLGTSNYFANICPPTPDEIPSFLNAELVRIQAAVAALAEGHIDKVNVAPTKPRDGDIRYADGTNWNPGSGIGLYQRQGLSWMPIQIGTPLTTAAGTYTPTLTGTANVAASTAYECQYLRVGATVTVSGKVDVDPTSAVDTQLGISLPISSNFGAIEDCAGVAAAFAVAGQSAVIQADTTNDRALMRWLAVNTANQNMFFTFTYQII